MADAAQQQQDARAVAANINQEQLFHELEQKFLAAKSELAVLEAEKQDATNEKHAALDELKRLQALATERDAELAAVKDELLRVTSAQDQLSFQLKSAQALAERRLSEIEALQATVKDQAKQLVESQRREMEALQRAGEHEAHVEPLRHRIARLETDVANAKQQNEWLENQVAEKTKFTHELRKTLSQQTHDLEELKMKSTEELTSAKRQLESARQVSKKLESSLIQSKEYVKEVQAAKAHDEARFEHELSAQRRLADLYKESANDATARVTELQELCDSLRQSLAETEEALSLETERTKAQVEHLFREQADASEKIIETLQAQLQDATSKIEELEKKKIFSLQTASSVADLSSAAGEAHLAAHGLTPKQMYDHIVELEETLRDERTEKEKLQLYMDRIVREVQEKAPIIMGLRLDHERAVASHAQMTERLDVCMQELTKSKRNETLARTDKRALETKCASLTQSVDDLSRQVQHLLFRAQESRSARLAASPGDVVSENLVVFKDVAELQVRNQQLLTVIRELSDAAKRQDEPGRTSDSSAAHLIASGDSDDESERGLSAAAITARLAQARDEVQELRAEREQERQMIAAIVKQRDMYRVLLAQSDTKFLESNNSNNAAETRASASAPAAGTTRRASFDMAESKTLRDLQTEFADYKKEKQINTKLLQDALDQVRAEASQARLAQLQAEVEVKCTKERFDASESRRRDVEDECVRVRSKNEQLSALLLQQQQQLSDTESKLDAAVAQAQRLSIEKASATRDAEYLKKHELKLQQELTSLRLDNTNVLKLMESTRRMDAMRDERAQRETDALTQKVSSLESRLQDAYAKHEARESLVNANLLAAEQEKKAAQTELDKVTKRYAETHERVVRLEEQKTAADSKAALLEKDVTHLREQLRKGASAAAAERVAALEVQLRDAQRDVHASLALRKSLTENVARYKAIAEANEKSLAELSSASETWKATQARKLEALEAERLQLQDDLANARARVKEHVTELHALRNELDEAEAAHKVRLNAALEQQRAAEIQADGAQREIAALRDEMALLKHDLATTQDNYERELQLHAAEVAKASAARKLMEDEQTKRQALAASVCELETRLATADKEAQDELARLRQDVRDAADANESLAQQNKLLHAQLERAATQVRRAHEQELMKSVLDKRSSSDAPSSDATVQQHEKEVDDLRSVIAFLRRESDIASSKLDVAQQEVQRYRAQVFRLESTSERLRDEIKALAATASATTASSDTSATVSDAAKRFAQLEQLSLLRESNATLRDESQKSLAKLQAEEAKVAALEAQLAPLRASEAALKSRIASLEQEVATLNEANKRWKQRVDQLVEKYQQVDPAEHDKVVAEHAALVQEVAALKTSHAAVQTELETLRASEGKSLAEEQTKVENWRKQYDRIKGFAKTWKTKAETLSKQVAEKTKELDDKTAQLTDVDAKIRALESDRAALESKLAAAEASKQDSGDAAASLSAQNEKERVDLRERLEAEQKKSTQLKDFNQRLMVGLKALKKENTELRGQAATAAAAVAVPSPPPVAAVDQSVKDDESTAAPTSSDSVTAAAAGTASASAPDASAPVALKPATSPVQPPLPPVNSAPKHAAAAAVAPAPTVAAAPAALTTSVAPPAPPAAAPPANVVSFMKSPPAPPTPEPAPAPPAPLTAVTSAPTPPTVSFGSDLTALKAATAASSITSSSSSSTTTTTSTTAASTTSTFSSSSSTSTTSSAAPAPVPSKPVEVKAPPAVPLAPAQPPLPPVPSSAPTVSAEEKLRLSALQSMKKQVLAAKPVAAAPAPAAPTGLSGTPAKPAPTSLTTSATTTTPVKLPPKPATGSSEEDALKAKLASSGPFLKLSPAAGSFGAFGSGGASGLVFGKPGITLPIPASPTPAIGVATAAAPAAAAPPPASVPAAAPAVTSSASVPTPAATPTPSQPVETEAQRRSQRLARFAAQKDAAAAAAAAAAGAASSDAAAPASGNPAKRPASGSIDISTPQKMAKITTTVHEATEETKEQDGDESSEAAAPSS